MSGVQQQGSHATKFIEEMALILSGILIFIFIAGVAWGAIDLVGQLTGQFVKPEQALLTYVWVFGNLLSTILCALIMFTIFGVREQRKARYAVERLVAIHTQAARRSGILKKSSGAHASREPEE